ncbi:LppU/SCO3897 family protein [Actinokineospora pegani]|uniref:LppU/SCO3897 family protein n=1 Tax=Actinokineospora pegani TaxID=2654637 RepID=UPI0012EA31A9|nr:hypothetical protein [Actinokineospora pegani]
MTTQPPPDQPPPGQQPPPQGQPFQGQPPHGQPFPGQPGQPTAPQQQPPKKRSWKTSLAVLLVLGLVLGGAYIWQQTSTPSGAEVGECIKVNRAEADDADVDKIDCSEPGAVFVITKRSESSVGRCPEGDFLQYTSRGRGGAGYGLCLALNVEKGDCLNDLESAEKAARVDCAGAQYEVLDVLDGETEKTKCREVGADTAFAYSDPAKAICIKINA